MKSKNQFGFNARLNQGRSWSSEVSFAKKNDFDLLQLYTTGKSKLEALNTNTNKIIQENFPLIIHAVLEANEIKPYISQLVEATLNFGASDLIIHPVNEDNKTAQEFSYELNKASLYTAENKVKLFLENNSRIHPIFNSTGEIKLAFKENSELHFLLDIAHMENYSYLENLIEIKKPEMLHVADRHFTEMHEHLPIGEGDIDFNKIFHEIIPDFSGKIIFEINRSDEALIQAKTIISNI